MRQFRKLFVNSVMTFQVATLINGLCRGVSVWGSIVGRQAERESSLISAISAKIFWRLVVYGAVARRKTDTPK